MNGSLGGDPREKRLDGKHLWEHYRMKGFENG